MKRYLVPALILVFVFICLWAIQSRDPHDFEGKCDLCHLGLNDPTILNRAPNRLCLSCHPQAEERSHPSDFIPQKAVAERFPLFQNKMVCQTCHFPHKKFGPETGAEKLPQPGPYLLRGESAGRAFCALCHSGDLLSYQVDSHALAGQRAHKASLDYELKDMIDDNSRECLSCHDGTLSIAANTQIREISWDHPGKIGMSHPISMDYMQVYLEKPSKYHSPESLDSRILLVEGKVGCETCHNHYSEHDNYLVMDNIMSRLCLSCHNL